MRICLVASSRFPIREPFHGGLEAHTSMLARALVDRGHGVSVFAAPGSDPALGATELAVEEYRPSAVGRADVGAPPERWMQEHHAYLGLMLELSRTGGRRFDVVHNNSLHHLPVAMAPMLDVPVVTTVHTPPVPWLESAAQLAGDQSRWVAVSGHTQRAWRHVIDATVVHNGVDTSRWTPGPGGTRAVWSGRVVPEKAPHLAIDAARAAGLAIDLVGPVQDAEYARREVEPRLGPDAVHHGHLGTDDLAALVGRAAVAVVSPVWEEPYGLVVAEAMATGTPVAAFARGAIPELVDDEVGALAPPDDVTALADAIRRATTCDRRAVRRRAVRSCSVETMVAGYETVYRDLLDDRRAA